MHERDWIVSFSHLSEIQTGYALSKFDGKKLGDVLLGIYSAYAYVNKSRTIIRQRGIMINAIALQAILP